MNKDIKSALYDITKDTLYQTEFDNFEGILVNINNKYVDTVKSFDKVNDELLILSNKKKRLLHDKNLLANDIRENINFGDRNLVDFVENVSFKHKETLDEIKQIENNITIYENRKNKLNTQIIACKNQIKRVVKQILAIDILLND